MAAQLSYLCTLFKAQIAALHALSREQLQEEISANQRLKNRSNANGKYKQKLRQRREILQAELRRRPNWDEVPIVPPTPEVELIAPPEPAVDHSGMPDRIQGRPGGWGSGGWMRRVPVFFKDLRVSSRANQEPLCRPQLQTLYQFRI